MSGTSRIGIDLDHTIMNYGAEDGSEILFGFKAFVMEQREAKRKLFILCHLDGDREQKNIQSDLKGHGLFKAMDAGGFGFQADDIIYIQSNEEMAGKVKALKLTHFVDSSCSLTGLSGFPKSTQPLVLGDPCEGCPNFPDWSELSNYFQWEAGLRAQTDSRLIGLKAVKTVGDNYIYRLDMEDGASYCLKRHFEQSDSDRKLLEAELAALDILRGAGIENIPVAHWHSGSWAILSWIDGKPVSTPGDDHVAQLVELLGKLIAGGDHFRSKNLPHAVGARLRFSDYVDVVNSLWQSVLRACQRPDGPKDVLLFMMTDMEQMRQDHLNHLYLWCKRQGWDRDAAFPENELIFSPVDFGLHNALEDESGKLTFLDFEMSGWDDPAHLLADFFHNPEHQLSMSQKLQVLDGFVKSLSWGKEFLNRFWAVADLVAVEWIFKTLKVVIPEEMRKVQFISPDIDPKKVIRDRFKQAVKMNQEFKNMERLCKHDQLLDTEDL